MEVLNSLAEVTSGWIPWGLIIIGGLYVILAIINFCMYQGYDDEALIRGWCSTISAAFVIALRILYQLNFRTPILVVTIIFAIVSIIMVVVQIQNDCFFGGISSGILNTITTVVLLLQVAAAVVAGIAGVVALIIGGIFVKGGDN